MFSSRPTHRIPTYLFSISKRWRAACSFEPAYDLQQNSSKIGFHVAKHGLRSNFIVLGCVSLLALTACQKTAGTNSKSFDDATSSTPAAPLKVQAQPAHVASECPKMAGTFVQDGQDLNVLLEASDVGSTYVFTDGRMIIADGEKHIGPEGKDAAYVATCKDGELKVVMTPVVTPKDGKGNEQLDLSFKAFTVDGDFKVTMRESGGKTEEAIMLNAKRPLPRAKHTAESCPVLAGNYVDGSSKISFETTSAASGATYKVQEETFVADGQLHAMKDPSGEFDTYTATCDSNTVKVYLGKRGSLVRVTSFELLAGGEIGGVSLSTSSGRREEAILKPAPAAAIEATPDMEPKN